VSRIDLCGNGVVTVPGELLVYRSGRRNRFKEDPSIRAPYRWDTSLVARSLLLEPTFDAVSDIQAFVASRGGSPTIGTASKALKQLEEDFVIERAESPSVRLLQADRLLDQLAANYRPPKILRKWTGKTSLAPEELVQRLSTTDAEALQVVRTGAGSADEYVAFAREPVMECYCNCDPGQLIEEFNMPTAEPSQIAL